MIRAWWERWVRFSGRPIDARPLVLVRIFVPLCILGDLIDMMVRGATDGVVYTSVHGGINAVHSPQYFLGDGTWPGPLLVALLCLTMPLVALGGRACRPALLVGLIAAAQFGHFYQPGDRAIDRLLRTALLILLFSEVTAPKVPKQVAAWPVDLMKFLLVLIYLAAGFAKIGGSMGWWHPEMTPELLKILSDPSAGKLDPWFWDDYWPIFWFGSVATLILEFTPFLILTRWCRYWAVFGAFMHLGILSMMYLGMFSLGMLAFYPLLFSPWTEQWLDRFGVRLGLDAHPDDDAVPARAGSV